MADLSRTAPHYLQAVKMARIGNFRPTRSPDGS